MILSAAAVRRAIGQHIAADLAEAIKLPDPVADDDVAALVAHALGCEDAELTSALVVLPAGGGAARLERTDLDQHAVFHAGAPRTLLGALSAPFLAGTRVGGLAADAPSFGSVTLSDVNGAPSGWAVHRFGSTAGPFSVTFLYGREDDGTGLARTVRLAGEALRQCGEDARGCSAARRVLHRAAWSEGARVH